VLEAARFVALDAQVGAGDGCVRCARSRGPPVA